MGQGRPVHQSLPPALVRLWSLLVAICLPVAAAHAQPKPPGKPPPVQIVNIDLGWDNVVPGDRWSPVTVQVTSQQNAFSGILEVEYDQDATQLSRLVTPIATTPGRVTPVELAIAPPPNCKRISFNIYDQSGGNPVRWEYMRGSLGDELPMPHIGAAGGLIVTLSDSTARLTVARYQLATPEDPKGPRPGAAPNPAPYAFYQPNAGPKDLWSQIQLSRINPDHVPMAWSAFEGVDLFVAKADDLMRCDARARDALLTWVRAGGRLLLQADAASDWRTLLAGEDLITLDPLQKVQAGGDLAGIVRQIAENDPATTTARLIHLTPAALARGWTLSWPASPAVPNGVPDTTAATEAGAGLLASGPFGLGMITVIGVEPQSLPQALDPKVTSAVWRAAITPALGPHAIHAANDTIPTYYAYSPNFQDDDQSVMAIHAALDLAATVPPLGRGIFIAIAACMALLALMLGPIDAITLRRFRQSQRSWLTALLWISIASIAAYLAPRALRSGETVAHRTSVADIICDQDGLPLSTARAAVTGIFGGRPINVAIKDAAPGSWFRGVSSIEPYSEQSRSLFSPLILPIKVQQQDPFLLGAPPLPFSVSQWTFRGLLDQTPLHPAKATGIGAMVRPRRDGAYDITLFNAPASVTSAEVALHTGEHHYSTLLRAADGPATKVHDLTGSTSPTPDTIAPTQPQPGSTISGYPVAAPVLQTPTTGISADPIAFLPGARDRAAAMEAMIKSGHYACLTVHLKDLPLDLTLENIPNLQTQHTAFLRILAPLEKEPMATTPNTSSRPSP